MASDILTLQQTAKEIFGVVAVVDLEKEVQVLKSCVLRVAFRLRDDPNAIER